MAGKKQSRTLWVYMNGIIVGHLARASTGQLNFQYDASWLSHTLSRPISLSMPLTELPYKGQVVENYFENLLPDSDLIRRRIQTRFHTPSIRCFDLLSEIGGDCVGALQLLTAPLALEARAIQAEPLSSSDIASLIKSYQSAPLGMKPGLDFRISIAGAQEKTALLWHQGKWCIPKGTTATSHIVKLPIGRIPHAGIDLSNSVENEWLCLQILAAYNLPVNKAQIIQFDDMKTLVVERFDRVWTGSHSWLMRLPQEDFCQVLAMPPGLKYESDGGPGIKRILDMLQLADGASEARAQFFKTVFLFWVMGAIDGHAKNFSILLKPQGRFQLTPIYDVISAYPLAAKRELEWKKLKMAMALQSTKKHYHWQQIQLRHWLSMAKYCHFPQHKMKQMMISVFDEMDTVLAKVKSNLPDTFPEAMSESIFQGMESVKQKVRF